MRCRLIIFSLILLLVTGLLPVAGACRAGARQVSSLPPRARRCAHGSLGATGPAETWYLAEGATLGGFETWVLVANPGSRTAHVTLTYMTDTGEEQGPTIDLAPGSRESVNVADTVQTYEVSTKVTSDEPVIAERSLYYRSITVGLDPGHSMNCPSSEIDTETGLDVADNGGAAGELATNWELALATRSCLEQMGYTVKLTKPEIDAYASLRTRADIGNTCAIMVRLHYDFNLHAILFPAEGQYKQHGSSIVYVDPAVAASSAELAEAMFPFLQGVGVTRMMNDCGGTSSNTGPAFVGSVLSRVPVVLIENDPAWVRDNPAGQDRVAADIAQGIDAYFRK